MSRGHFAFFLLTKRMNIKSSNGNYFICAGKVISSSIIVSMYVFRRVAKSIRKQGAQLFLSFLSFFEFKSLVYGEENQRIKII